MSWRRILSVRWVAAAALLLVAGSPAFGAGFGIFEHGSKAMGMAGAFTAQADDPSLLFHNAGGLAFVNQDELAAGATWIKGAEAEFEGAAPFPGPGVSAEQELLSEFPPHIYYVAPINNSWKWGIGVNAPFGLVTEWKDPDTFAGRFISTKASLEGIDINPTIGWQISPNFGLGFGAIGRLSAVELNRNIATVNPFTQTAVDVGRVKIESDGYDTGYGWNVGLLHKVTPRVSWGLSYRSQISIDFAGEGRLTQVPTGNAQLDAIVRSRTPFDTNLPVKTTDRLPGHGERRRRRRHHPAAARRGGRQLDRLEHLRGGRHRRRRRDGARRLRPQQQPGAGARHRHPRGVGGRDELPPRRALQNGPTTEWRFGYVYDETPQPEEVVSPLLPDANRNGFTVGYGSTGPGLKWDVALMYLMFDERERHHTLPNEPVLPRHLQHHRLAARPHRRLEVVTPLHR